MLTARKAHDDKQTVFAVLWQTTTPEEEGISPEPEADEPVVAGTPEDRTGPGHWNPLAMAYQSDEELWAWFGNWDL